MFPFLKDPRVGYVNLNEWARELVPWTLSTLTASDTQAINMGNPYLDAHVCEAMVEEVHRRLGLNVSYGGWLEDRSILWAGSYLEKEEKFIHLGIDINMKTGTDVALDYAGTVLQIDDDHPERHGWGPRVFIQLREHPIILLYAHLSPDLACKTGDKLSAGDVFALVGKTSHNGAWFPHLHVQALTTEAWQKFKKNPLQLDGYGVRENIENLARLYPDPTPYLRLI